MCDPRLNSIFGRKGLQGNELLILCKVSREGSARVEAVRCMCEHGHVSCMHGIDPHIHAGCMCSADEAPTHKLRPNRPIRHFAVCVWGGGNFNKHLMDTKH